MNGLAAPALVGAADPVLRARAQEIVYAEQSAEIREWAQRLTVVCEIHGGVGLAGPQIGLPWRIIHINYGGRRIDAINPIITSYDRKLGKYTATEGCLSFPGVLVDISRWKRIKISYTDVHGVANHHYAQGMLARVWQHEIDHLDGIVITER